LSLSADSKFPPIFKNGILVHFNDLKANLCSWRASILKLSLTGYPFMQCLQWIQSYNHALQQGLPDGIHIFLPKITIRVNLERPWNENVWVISRSFGLFSNYLVSVMVILCILWSFGI
jgi:hypothetical protein